MASLERAAQRIRRFERRHPDAARLARLASLAVRVEPQFLRTLRQELLPDADVGAEADLWFSPLIESRGAAGFVLDPSVAELLREDLAGDPSTLERVAAITESAHRHAAPSIRLEQRVNALALGGGDAALDEIEEELRAALRALRESDDRGLEVARWAMRALPRFHPAVRRTDAALSLWLAASALLGGRRILKEAPERAVPLASVAWAIPDEALRERVSVSVQLVERGIRFVNVGEGTPDTDEELAAVIELPRTHPLLVGLTWTAGDGAPVETLVEVEPGRVIDLQADVDAVTLRTLAGDTYELESEIAESGARFRPDLLREHRAVAEACVRVSSLGENIGPVTGLVVGPRIVAVPAAPFRAGGPTAFPEAEGWGAQATVAFRGIPQLSVDVLPPRALEGPERERPEARLGSEGGSVEAAVLNPYDDDVVLLLELQGSFAFDEPARLGTAPVQYERSEINAETNQPLFEAEPQPAVVLGFDGAELSAVLGGAIVHGFQGEKLGVRVIGEALPDGFLGGPVIMQGRVVGIVTSLQVSPPPTSREEALLETELGVTGSIAIRRVVDRITEQRHAGRDRIFISYSHADMEWLRRLETHLAAFGDRLDVWSDEKIREGSDWVSEIQVALDRAKVAVLLVSPEFVASDFIRRHEVPKILEAAERNELTLIWIHVSDSHYQMMGLDQKQASHDVSKPLDSLAGYEREKVLLEISVKIREAFESGPPVAEERELVEATFEVEEMAEAPLEVDEMVEAPLEVEESRVESTTGPTSGLVTMGFGTKIDPATGRELDLDESYSSIIKPALEAAGVSAIRADRLPEQGTMAPRLFEALLDSDLVIADLSTANPNAVYQLGVRHGLRPFSTVVIGESGLRLPSPLDAFELHRYDYLGSGIDAKEMIRFRGVLEGVISDRLGQPRVDSPVYGLLPDLQPPESGAALSRATPGPAHPRTCFVAMASGVRAGFASDRRFDLDRSYHELIRPAVEEVGLECVRMGELADRTKRARVYMSYLPGVEPDGRVGMQVLNRLNRMYDVYSQEIAGGESMSQPEDEIALSDFFVVFLSAESLRSSWVRREIEMAYRSFEERARPIILPVSLDDEMPSDPAMTYLSNIARMDWRGDEDTPRVVQKLIEAIDRRHLDDTSEGKLLERLFDYLLNAALVIVDISASDPSSLYMLGVRHALQPRGTLVIADGQSRPSIPLDSNRIFSYEDYWQGAESLARKRLTEAIMAIPELDSPVYLSLPDLQPPRLDRV